jgi:hypothetical protein
MLTFFLIEGLAFVFVASPSSSVFPPFLALWTIGFVVGFLDESSAFAVGFGFSGRFDVENGDSENEWKRFSVIGSNRRLDRPSAWRCVIAGFRWNVSVFGSNPPDGEFRFVPSIGFFWRHDPASVSAARRMACNSAISWADGSWGSVIGT